MTNTKLSSQTYAHAPLLKRFAAWIYDGFILFSFLILLTAIALLINQGQSLEAYHGLFLSYLIVSLGCFLAWFWKRGQTLGMLAWKIYVVTEDNIPLSFKHAFARYLLALLSFGLCGIGFIWCLLNKDRQTLHDKIAKTRIVRLQ